MRRWREILSDAGCENSFAWRRFLSRAANGRVLEGLL